MSPGAAAGGFARTFGWALWVAIGGDAVVIGVEPVGAPFVDVCADVEEAVGVFLAWPTRSGRSSSARRNFRGFRVGRRPRGRVSVRDRRAQRAPIRPRLAVGSASRDRA